MIRTGHEAIHGNQGEMRSSQLPKSATGGDDAKVLRRDGIPRVEFGFGTQTAHGTDEHTTTRVLARNAISYGTLPVLYGQLASADG